MLKLDKNEPLPDVYRDFLYQYTVLNFGLVLPKNNDEIFLQGENETTFRRECNRAKQKGRSLSAVINDYF
jgi:hypothetical protein